MPDLRAVVCIPWIDTGCPWRAKSREWTAAHWASIGVPVVYGLDDSHPVNRARARNAAARNVVADVLAFMDADTWVDAEQFEESVEAAHQTGRLIHAYTLHTRLSKSSTLKTLDGDTTTIGSTVRNAPAGAIAVSRELFETVGGWDERFLGWGYEDRCFQFACDTIAGAGRRIAGHSYHLYHPRGRDQIQTTNDRRRGAVLAEKYKVASGIKVRAGIVRATKNAERNREAMLAILSEPGGPLDPARLAVPASPHLEGEPMSSSSGSPSSSG